MAFESASMASDASAVSFSARAGSQATSRSLASTTWPTPRPWPTCSSTTRCTATLPAEVAAKGEAIFVDGREIRVCAIKDPAALPWKELGVDIVVESTGLFRDSHCLQAPAGRRQEGHHHRARQGSGRHPGAGRQREDVRPGQAPIVSNASCTTNCLATTAKVLDDKFGIKRGFASTVHSYTNDQTIHDFPHKDLRRARAGAVNMIPTTTGRRHGRRPGAAEAEGQAGRHRHPRAHHQRLGRRSHRRAGEAGDGRGGERRVPRGGGRARSRASWTPPTRSWCRATSTATPTPRSWTCRRPRSWTATW